MLHNTIYRGGASGANWWMPFKLFLYSTFMASSLNGVNGDTAHQCWMKGVQEIKKTVVITNNTDHTHAVD